MDSFRLDNILDLFHGRGLVLGLLWLGLIFLIVALMVLMYTRWGTMRPLRKCLGLSIAAHLLLVIYSTTVYVAPAMPFLREQIIRVSLSDEPPRPSVFGNTPNTANSAAKTSKDHARPWETFAVDSDPAWNLPPVPRAAERALPIPERMAVAEGGDSALPAPRLEKPLLAIPPPLPKPMRPDTPAPKPGVNRPPEPIQAPVPQSRPGARADMGGLPQFERLTPIDRPTRPPTRTASDELAPAPLKDALAVPRLKGSPVEAETPRSLAAVNQDALPKRPSSPLDFPSGKAVAQHGPATRSVPRADDRMSQSPSDSPPDASPVIASRLKPPTLANAAMLSDFGESVPAAAGVLGTDFGPPRLPPIRATLAPHEVPELYRLRLAPNRSQLSERLGATPELETAVKAGLKWLADHQEPDGRWNPRKHEGGREILEAGRDRQGAGATADTGVTGLALLAFAAAGNTHLEGPHRATVRRGVEFLFGKQGTDGALGGEARLYEFMYCHGMATLALSELAGMSGDSKLRRPLAQAVAYTLAAQDPAGGGWRYRPREAGDTSQFGWQIMALKSAAFAGISIPESTWRGAQRFLESVSGGRRGGLAAYRPDEDFTHSMTAEALACRQFLGLAIDSPTAKEAGDYLLGNLPGQGEPNLYYWYYGSIAMYQLQGEYWKRWSAALRNTLLRTQRTTGALAGSWDPNTRWDGYGGRVYSTALATLCLEAHYRFLPLNALGKAVHQPSTTQR